MEKSEFLSYLKDVINQYNLMSDFEGIKKAEKKQYINGLMRASRFFCVSFEELKAVVDQSETVEQSYDESFVGTKEPLEIPTFVRQNKIINI